MPVLSDRSGIDPIIYATIYGPPHGRESLESTRQWQILRSRMMNSLVILCPPHQEWLTDDGTRLVASSWKDWQETHTTFCQVLAENSIPFVALPDHLLELQDRVDFVFREWTTAFPRVITNTPSVSRGLSDQPNQQLVGDASNS
ncbi:uncharacterized protein BDW43DRAFT_289906 [Aspergillus alliaceus]|uniref:uncharacterized protein n=1 Tax=Petromyces alliaceus TaxID=209559 RepID=UPI0012A58C82|nr:uncharacterized protein BDW43DRAFT_289906 [Aspergillus alliaceus]KAB8228849.1 hypothetical protein BDW43DRAFT_289906 [Aspergillus alliaceus]